MKLTFSELVLAIVAAGIILWMLYHFYRWNEARRIDDEADNRRIDGFNPNPDAS